MSPRSRTLVSPGDAASRVASKAGPEFDGLLLAGGRSRRFGEDKRRVVFEGEPLSARAMRKLAQVVGTGTIFVATGAVRERLPGTAGAVIVADEPPGKGPLGGIVAALARSRVGVLVLACDVPRVRAATLTRVAAVGARLDRPAAVCTSRGWEPLVAYYPSRVFNHVRAAISGGMLAPHVLLDRLDAIPVRVADRSELANINRPGDLAALQAAPTRR